MGWNNWGKEDDNEVDEIVQTEQLEPKKVIDSVANLATLSNRTQELSSQILADIDSKQTLTKQILNLNIDEVNKAVSKETLYKTEEELSDAFSNEILNHNNGDLFKNTTYNISVERKKRYDLYEQLVTQNYLASNILSAFKDNMLIRSAQTKNFLNIVIPDEKTTIMDALGNDLKNNYEKLQLSIMLKYKLQSQLKDLLVPKTTLLGNYFIEIIDLNKLGTSKGGISRHEQILMENANTNTNTNTNTNNKNKVELPSNSLYENTSYTNNTIEVRFQLNKNEKDSKDKEIKEHKILLEFSSNFETFSSYEELQEHCNEIGSAIENAKIINENEKNSDTQKTSTVDTLLKDVILTESSSGLEYDFTDYFKNMDQVSNENDFKPEDITTLSYDCLKDIYLEYIHPKNVIIIENNNMIYGYLILMENEANSHEAAEIDTFKRFASGLTDTAINGAEKHENKTIVKKMVDTLSDEILKKVVHNIRLNKKRSMGTNFDYFKTLDLNEEALMSLKLLIYNKIKNKSKLKFKFVTSESVVNFSTGVDKYAPYGTSVLDAVSGPIKLYNLALMSSVVSRLSRAAVVRKWTIEAGEKRNHKEIVDATTAEIKSKAITFDKINQMKNISEIITDFRDIATITINNNRFIDMELLPMQDRGLPLNDLETLKQDIISAGKVPAIYLNISDAVDLRERLVHLNINFASDIIEKQNKLEEGLDSLNSNIFRLILKYNNYNPNSFTLSNYIKLKLNAPLVLQLQADEAQVSVVSTIISNLKQMNVRVDPIKLLKRYIPNINWEVIDKEGKDYEKTLAATQITNPNQGGGF